MKNTQGFTLIELMIVVAIIGALMAYIIPSYQRQVIRSKRVESQSAIMQIAAAEEKHNATYNTYTTVIGGAGNDGDSLGLGSLDFNSSVNYDFAVTAANGYTITATAKGPTQVNDTLPDDCTTMSIDSLGTKLPLACWQ